jgi:hypothetical protein
LAVWVTAFWGCHVLQLFFFNLILKAQPRRLDVDPSYVQNHILPAGEGKAGKALTEWLKGEFRKRFRFVKRPPKWIQSPDWPINDNGPLVFLGQLNVENYFHDAATVYVFHDPVTGACSTVIQVY